MRHVTVICYNLQHPAAFSEEAIEWMRSTLRAIAEEGLSPAELRKRSQKQPKGQVKVLNKTPKKPGRVEWPMTVKSGPVERPLKAI